MLRHTSTVDELSKHFIALLCCNMTLSEAQQIQMFITGLGDPLRTDVALQQPTTLDDAVIFTRSYEQRNTSRETTPAVSERSFGRSALRSSATVSAQASTPSPATSSPSVGKSSTTSLRLSPTEVAQRHKDDKCFHCDEVFHQWPPRAVQAVVYHRGGQRRHNRTNRQRRRPHDLPACSHRHPTQRRSHHADHHRRKWGAPRGLAQLRLHS
jgi:hypothetical protein